MIKVAFKNVKWDTDGVSLKDCGLEKKFVSDVDIDYDYETTDEELENMISDWLSDNFGYCHNGFDFEIIAPEIITSNGDIKKFFVEATDEMIKSEDDIRYIIPFAKTDNDETISIMLLWEDGFDIDENNKYIDKNGYGINVCLVKNDTSYLMEDWKHLTDTCFIDNNFDDIIDWLKEELKRVSY